MQRRVAKRARLHDQGVRVWTTAPPSVLDLLSVPESLELLRDYVVPHLLRTQKEGTPAGIEALYRSCRFMHTHLPEWIQRSTRGRMRVELPMGKRVHSVRCIGGREPWFLRAVGRVEFVGGSLVVLATPVDGRVAIQGPRWTLDESCSVCVIVLRDIRAADPEQWTCELTGDWSHIETHALHLSGLRLTSLPAGFENVGGVRGMSALALWNNRLREVPLFTNVRDVVMVSNNPMCSGMHAQGHTVGLIGGNGV